MPDGLWSPGRPAALHTAMVTDRRHDDVARPGPPLARSFERLNARDMWLHARIAAAPEDGWLQADRIQDDPSLIDALWTVANEATGGADPRTVGIMLMWRYGDVARLATTLFVLERRVPDLDPGGTSFLPYDDEQPTRVSISSSGFACLPDDPDAGHKDARPRPLESLRATLLGEIERFVGPAIEPIAARTHLGAKVLWGVVASTSLTTLAEILAEQGEPDRAAAEVTALLRHGGPLAAAAPSLEVMEHAGERRLVITDGICCRIYLWPAGRSKCAHCPLLSRDERVVQQLAGHA